MSEEAGKALSRLEFPHYDALAMQFTPRYAPPPLPRTMAESSEQLRMPCLQRWMLLLAGSGLTVLLVTAAALQPDPSGYGTHRRLGLPPCTMVALYGIRCPACGMTTSWSCLMRGQWSRAVQANAGGFLMGLLAAAASPWLLASAARGKWLIGCPNEWLILGTGLLFVVVTLGDWVVRIYR